MIPLGMFSAARPRGGGGDTLLSFALLDHGSPSNNPAQGTLAWRATSSPAFWLPRPLPKLDADGNDIGPIFDSIIAAGEQGLPFVAHRADTGQQWLIYLIRTTPMQDGVTLISYAAPADFDFPAPAGTRWTFTAKELVLRDTFTRADGPLRGTVADTGQVWGGPDDKIRIASGKAGPSGSGDNFASVSTGPLTGPYRVSADLTYATSSLAYLVFRAPPGGAMMNFWVACFGASGVTLRTKATSALNIVASSDGEVTAGDHAVEVLVDGDQITVRLDGAAVITHTSTTYADQTGVGVYSWGNNQNRWDNLVVEEL